MVYINIDKGLQMKNNVNENVPLEKNAIAYIPLEMEKREVISTNAAAYHLNRKPQTLFTWSCLENGPIRPIRINGRLAWRVSDLKKLLTGENAITSKVV